MRSPRLTAFLAAVFSLLVLAGIVTLTARWPARAAQAARVVPVEARVTASSYREWRSGKNTRCEHQFRFVYAYDGRQYESANLANWGLSSNCRDRGLLLAGLRVGQTFTAYHDPAAPETSFASPVSAQSLYVLPVVFGLTLIGVWLVLRTRDPMAQRTTDARGFHLLRIPLPLGAIAAAATAGVVWWVLGCSIALLFWKRALIGRGVEGTDTIAPIIGLVVLGAIALVFRARRHVFDDPSIAMTPYPASRGSVVTISVTQRVREEAEIHSLRLRLEGRWQRGKQSKIVAKAEQTETIGRRVSSGTLLKYEMSFAVPVEEDDRLASSWHLSLFVDGPGIVNHHVSIPVQVQ